jgi:hypothetical protein
MQMSNNLLNFYFYFSVYFLGLQIRVHLYFFYVGKKFQNERETQRLKGQIIVYLFLKFITKLACLLFFFVKFSD